jgi:GrpB-like predicted nucleotidyltransferase (UPF0157 family)
MEFLEPDKVKERADLLYQKWKGLIESELPFSRVEHVGSTAIGGAITKGDVDLYVEVPPAEHEDAVKALENLGFRIKQDTHRDAELCMLESTDIKDLALQVVARGAVYEFFIKFRDALNADESLVERYNALKAGCSGCSQEEYRRKKSMFIVGVLEIL